MHYSEITSFKAACIDSGYSMDLPDVSMIPDHFQKVVINFYQLIAANEAINRTSGNSDPADRNWKPNYNNGRYKYYPVWNLNGTPGSFQFHICFSHLTQSGVGSYLEYEDLARAHHAVKYFYSQYKNAFVMP